MQTVAKTIVHVVVDALSGEPIGNARVEVTAQIASADSSGHYAPGLWSTCASHLSIRRAA